MATPRKRKKTSRDAYLRSWGVEGSAEKADATSLVDDADLPPERPELRVAGKARKETVVEPQPEPEEEEEEELMPKPGGQASEIHSSTVLQAMELRIDSISEALHRVEKRLAGMERSLESPQAARSFQPIPPETMPELAPTPAPAVPAVNPSAVGATWVAPRKPRRWPIWFVALVLGIIATLFSAYMGIGSVAPIPFSDLFDGTAPSIDYEKIIDSIDWVAGAIGAGIFLLFGGLITSIRGARYRRRLSAGHR